jgi:hypothetical protein
MRWQLRCLNGNNMRMIKGILFVFGGLFLMITCISLLMPSRVIVSRDAVMQGDTTKVFAQISDLKNWRNWHPVFMDTNTKFLYSDNTNSVNSFVEWMTNGKKNLLIITEVKYPLVKMNLERKGENTIENLFSVMPETEQGNVRSQWTAVNKLKWYPWEKFSGIFVEKMTGPGYEAALKNLKEYVAAHP